MLLIRQLPSELQELAIQEVNEVPSRIEDDINHILEWIRQQPHLNAQTDPQWIIVFLRGCKFSLQRTKEKLESYYTIRSVAPFYFTNRNPYLPELQQLYKLNVFMVLPRESPTAPTRVLFILRTADPEKCPLKNFVKTLLMLTDVMLYEDDASLIPGLEVIIDAKEVPTGYIGQLTPAMLKTIVTLLQRAYPSRIKGFHFINFPPFLQFPLTIFSSLLSSKLRNRLHLHSSDDQLFSAIPRVVFPEEYGGDAGPISKLTEKINKYMESHYEWLQDDSQYCTDESKRVGKAKTYDDFFNLKGSFRNLEID